MIPDTRHLLPSEARSALTSYLLERLESCSLNMHADPTYTYAQALGEMDRDIDGYAWAVLDACWAEARAEYDRKHPKLHTTGTVGVNGGMLYREGLPI